MGDKTAISWTDATWNPIRGCSKVSDGCKHCYAESVANRFSGPGLAYEGLVHIAQNDGRALGWNGQIRFVEEHLVDPLRWKRPRRIFVNSMSDLFHENVTDEMRDRIFAVMATCPQHTFQVLTKRPERMLAYLTAERTRVAIAQWWKGNHQQRWPDSNVRWNDDYWPFPNVWLGVSVENQKTADERIPLLLQTPAAVRFLSCEPLLGPIDLQRIVLIPAEKALGQRTVSMMALSGWHGGAESDRTRIDWVIAGGESGRNARPMHPDWPRSLRNQCRDAGVPFFFKQWGEWLPQTGGIAQLEALPATTPVTLLAADGHRGQSQEEMQGHLRSGRMLRVGSKTAGHLLDGVEHHAFPEVR